MNKSRAYRIGDLVDVKLRAEIIDIRKYNDTLGMQIKFEINTDSECCSLPVKFWGWPSDICNEEGE